jgi:hypothetical protein
MIIFASGRTDVPAFYSAWFMNRIREGFVCVRNPYNAKQVTRYTLSPDVVDCIVFCTKNPGPMIPDIEKLAAFGFYFFVTITPYGSDIEPQVPAKDQVISDFIALSKMVGKDRICWRYDPVFLNSTYTPAVHIRSFRTMAEKLAGATDRCIISFIDLYGKTKKNFPGITEVSENDQRFLAQAFSGIAAHSGMVVESCAEKLDLSPYGVEPAGCLSLRYIERAAGIRLLPVREKSLRPHCTCLPSHDIGSYNTCPHGCRYCYANYDEASVRKNQAAHDDASPFLTGNSLPDDRVSYADQKSWQDRQLILW